MNWFSPESRTSDFKKESLNALTLNESEAHLVSTVMYCSVFDAYHATFQKLKRLGRARRRLPPAPKPFSETGVFRLPQFRSRTAADFLMFRCDDFRFLFSVRW